MSLVEWNRREKRLPESSVGHLEIDSLAIQKAKFKTCLRLGPSNVPFSHLRLVNDFVSLDWRLIFVFSVVPCSMLGQQ